MLRSICRFGACPSTEIRQFWAVTGPVVTASEVWCCVSLCSNTLQWHSYRYLCSDQRNSGCDWLSDEHIPDFAELDTPVTGRKRWLYPVARIVEWLGLGSLRSCRRPVVCDQLLLPYHIVRRPTVAVRGGRHYTSSWPPGSRQFER